MKIKPVRFSHINFLFKTYRYKFWFIAVLLLLFSTLAVHDTSWASVTPQIAGGGNHTIALKSNGTVCAWGYNGSGQLGDGTIISSKHAPVQVSGLSDVTALAGGWEHTIALKSDGTVWTWGRNSDGQLGDGTNTQRNIPVQVSGLNGVTAVACGYGHSITLKSDGTVWTWGGNDYGQLGDGATTDSTTPVQVNGLSDVTAIAGGGYHTIALKSDGTVLAWGSNDYGQLGDGTTTNRTTPVEVSGLSDVIAFAGGWEHTIALKSDGTVWAWGRNNTGQLGVRTTTQKSTPVQLSDLNDVIAIACGVFHTIALKSGGAVWAWGYNYNGQLGDGTNTDSATPVQVSGLSGATAIACGSYHTIALKSDGTVWTWGYNESGQLGDGTTTNRNTPVQVSNLILKPAIPTVTTTSATNVMFYSATLNGSINANDASTTVWFEYGTSSGVYSSSTTTETVNGWSDTNIIKDIDGLSSGITYYYRIAAQNSEGTSYGDEMSFTTLTDSTIPSCSISINNNATYTNNSTVTIRLTASDDYGVTGYYISLNSSVPSASDNGWTAIISITAYQADVSYTLNANDGDTTVYVWCKDDSGNVSDAATDSIILDTTAPSVTITSPTSGDTYTTASSVISIGGSASDITSGIEEITWSSNFGIDGTANGTTGWSILEISLLIGENTITVTATDNAGNTGTDVITVNFTEGGQGSISGYVVDIGGNPSENAKVSLKGKKVFKKTVSDEDGLFEFLDLDAGKYVIKAIKKGYKRYKQTISLKEGEEREIEIEMKKTSKRQIKKLAR